MTVTANETVWPSATDGLVAALEKISEAEPKFSGLCAQYQKMVMRFELEQLEFVLQEQLGTR